MAYAQKRQSGAIDRGWEAWAEGPGVQDLGFMSRAAEHGDPVKNPAGLPERANQDVYRTIPSVLFDKKEDGSLDIRGDDVQQGAVGDCWLIAPMRALAMKDPAAIQRLIVDNGDGTFDVTLYLPDNKKNLLPRVVTVDGQVIAEAWGWSAYGLGRWTKDMKRVLWGPLVEKALASVVGGYSKLDGDSWPHWDIMGLEVLTGRKSTIENVRLGDDKMWTTKLAGLVAAGPVVADTETNRLTDALVDEMDALGIIAEHAHGVDAVDVDSGKVTLNDPWQRRIEPITMAQFRRYFAYVRSLPTSAPSSGVVGG